MYKHIYTIQTHALTKLQGSQAVNYNTEYNYWHISLESFNQAQLVLHVQQMYVHKGFKVHVQYHYKTLPDFARQSFIAVI